MIKKREIQAIRKCSVAALQQRRRRRRHRKRCGPMRCIIRLTLLPFGKSGKPCGKFADSTIPFNDFNPCNFKLQKVQKSIPYESPILRFGRRLSVFDNVAEWSKALASGASPQGRRFEPCRYYLFIFLLEYSNA